MNPTPSRRRRRIAAAVSAVVVGAVAALTLGAPAHATGGGIDPGATGSLTVHKFEEPARGAGAPNDGTRIDTSGLTPIAGVTFEVRQVTGIDLSTDMGWGAVADLDAAEVLADPTAYPLGSARSVTTDAGGVAAFGNLPIGAYVVTETAAPDAVVFPARPFLVTVPMPVDGAWLYDVHVYPKNSVLEGEKTVDDADAAVLGDTVNWRIETAVPAVPRGETLSRFGVTDELDARLEAVLAEIRVSVGGQDLAATEFTTTQDGRVVRVELTAAGLARFAGRAGEPVVVTLPTVVTSIGDGTIVNRAQVWVNDPKNSFDTTKAKTEWGALRILKHAGADRSKPLAGAQFAVFRAADTGRTEPLLVDGDATIETGTDGTVVIAGLKAGEYVLVETRAPAGYQLDATPRPFTISAGSVTDAPTLAISNTQVPALMLPLTGGSGTAVFTIAGAGLLALAVGLILRRRFTAARA